MHTIQRITLLDSFHVSFFIKRMKITKRLKDEGTKLHVCTNSDKHFNLKRTVHIIDLKYEDDAQLSPSMDLGSIVVPLSRSKVVFRTKISCFV